MSSVVGLLCDLGVYIFVVVIGSDFIKWEFDIVVEDLRNVFDVFLFEDLLLKIIEIVRLIVERLSKFFF